MGLSTCTIVFLHEVAYTFDLTPAVNLHVSFSRSCIITAPIGKVKPF